MSKPTFLTYDRPLLTAMIQCTTPEACIAKIKASLDAGAEAFGIQLCRLRREFRTEETLSRIFAACEGRPIYVTSYRLGDSEGFTDEACIDLLFLALKSGATLLDIMGDMFQPGARYELATDETAIAKQKALIEEIHRRGSEVLMSSHTKEVLSAEENLMLAKAHSERGADIIKIVDMIEDMDQLPGYLESIQRIQKTCGDKKLLFLLSDLGRLIRYIGPSLGVCMYLCVESYGELDTPTQPLIQDVKAVRDHMVL